MKSKDIAGFKHLSLLFIQEVNAGFLITFVFLTSDEKRQTLSSHVCISTANNKQHILPKHKKSTLHPPQNLLLVFFPHLLQNSDYLLSHM